MDDDFFKREFDPPHRGHDNLFAWTVFILLLIGFALACWLGSFYLFGHPENQRCYEILKKLRKIEPPKRFELTAAPAGEFLTPQKLCEKYATMSGFELQNENAGLLRDYLRNYQDANKLVSYLIGRFSILGSHELKSGDLFPTGVVALAQSVDYPRVLVEHVYTSDSANVPQLKKMLMPGLDIKLEKTLDLSAIIHVERLDDGRLQFTAVPLLYGSYTLKQGSDSFSLHPPVDVHLEAGVPIIKPASLRQADKTYAEFRNKNTASGPNSAPSSEASTMPSNVELVRVMPPAALSTPASESKPSATPSPPPIARATPVPTAPALARNTTPAPRPSPDSETSPTPPISVPAPSLADHPGVPLQPFLESKPTPALTSTAGSWKIFHPGQMPRGRLLTAAGASELADRGTSGERLYLSGQFVVTATGANRAVLRSKGGLLHSLNPLDRSSGSSTRILVEFPAGSQPPGEGAAVSRDELRPFEIRNVQRAKDGTINVFVREITTPQ